MSETEETPGVGHNSECADVRGIAVEKLRSVIERYERLDSEIRGLRDDQKDIMAEAKSAGFDPKVLKQLIALRRQDPDEIEQREGILDTYKHALGM